MLVGISFNKFDASMILPVAHGRSEQRGSFVVEDWINLEWYHSIVPESIEPSSSCSLLAQVNGCCLMIMMIDVRRLRGRRSLAGEQDQNAEKRQ
jgi:hypothetical protein